MLNQKTTFPYEIIVHDDASSDNTRRIIENYWSKFPVKIKPIFQKENQFSKGRKIWTEIMLPEAVGKYIAICDGDDWWTDVNKLQKQIDFLENNPDYSICWTGYSERDGTIENPSWLKDGFVDEDITLENVFLTYRTYSLTAVFRKVSLDYNVYNRLKYSKDNTLYVLCLKNGKGRLLKEKTAIYNLHENGDFSKQSEKNKALKNYFNYNEICNKILNKQDGHIAMLRNYFLKQSLIFNSLRFNRISLSLLIGGLLYLGFKTTIKMVWNKIYYRF